PRRWRAPRRRVRRRGRHGCAPTSPHRTTGGSGGAGHRTGGRMRPRPFLALVGPTASGKTEASIGVAASLGAEILCIDSMLVYRGLASFDPAAAARIEPANGRRVVRALEVAAITGRPFSSGADAWASYPEGALAAAGVDLPRDVLRRRIEERTVHMMPGLLAE